MILLTEVMPETRTGHHSLFLPGNEGGRRRLNSDLLLPCQRNPTLILRFSTLTEMPVQSKGALCAFPSSTCKSHALLWHPVNGFGGGKVMSLHRDHGMSSTRSPRVAFPKDSWGNFQTIPTWEEQ